MVVDLVGVGDGADEVGADVALSAEVLEAAPDADVGVEAVARVLGLLLLVGVDELLDLELAGAVVDADGEVGGLRVEVADLADGGDLGDGGAVDLEVGAGVGLLGVEDLLDGYRPEGLVLEVLEGVRPQSTLGLWQGTLTLPPPPP